MKTFLFKSSLLITAILTLSNFYLAASSDTEITYSIIDKTVHFQCKSNIKADSYLWDFGSGETSTLKNPSHTYREYGTYTISLIILVEGKTVRTISKVISVKDKIKVSGTIFMGQNLLPDGYALLINLNKSSYSTNSTTEIFDGNFEFEDIDDGNYTILAIPRLNYGEFYFPKYISTYLGNTYQWENSSSFASNQTEYVYKINLISYSEPYYGEHSLKGEIIFDKNQSKITQNHTIVILLDSNKEPMDFQIIDSYNTKYSFQNLPAGQYYLHIEKPGFASSDLPVNINNNNEIQNKHNFLVGENTIEYQKTSEQQIVEVTTHFKEIKINVPFNNQTIICELFDTAGRKVFQTIKNSSEFYINTQNIKGGIYILKVKTFDNSNLRISKIFIDN